MSDSAHARILAVLTAEDPTLRAGAARLLVDHVLSQPLQTLLDPDTVSQLVRSSLGEPQLQRAIERHVTPGFAQFRAEVMRSEGTVGDAVPEDQHGPILDFVAAVVANPDGPRGRYLRGALSPKLLVDLLAPVFQDVLLGFIAKVPGAGGVAGGGGGGGSAAAGVMGMLGAAGRQRAGKLLDGAKSLAGGLGLESMLKPLAQDFSRGAVSAFQESLRKRLMSAEGREILGALQQGAFDHVMAVKLSDLDDDLQRIPVADLLAIVSPIVAHNLSRELGRAALAAQVTRYFALEGARPLGDVLADWGVEAEVRAVAEARATELSRALFSSDAFGAWLQSLLDAAG